MPINPRNPSGASTPLLRSGRTSHAQVGTTHSQTDFHGANILDAYLEHLIERRFLSADNTGVLTIQAQFIDLTYEPYINSSDVGKYLDLLGFTPTLATSGVKYIQTRYPNVQGLPDYENNVLPAIKQAWAANPPSWAANPPY
ncbi:hypothetical protein [Xenorhabdus bovienii]|uniref:hypothetical protein n=1 Tax=Xenorhabdus bovienii TaxID=40576 RepID=UPI0023B282F3|nr:hypothetical protein [Xenorhabdus bovienii]MDE9552959.1 hypothetical protein [Xenorhabdus bovienii]